MRVPRTTTTGRVPLCATHHRVQKLYVIFRTVWVATIGDFFEVSEYLPDGQLGLMNVDHALMVLTGQCGGVRHSNEVRIMREDHQLLDACIVALLLVR